MERQIKTTGHTTLHLQKWLKSKEGTTPNDDKVLRGEEKQKTKKLNSPELLLGRESSTTSLETGMEITLEDQRPPFGIHQREI